MRKRLSPSQKGPNFSPEESLQQLLNQIESNRLVQCKNCVLLPTCNNPSKGYDKGCNSGSSLSFIAWSNTEFQQFLSFKAEEFPLATDEPQKRTR